MGWMDLFKGILQQYAKTKMMDGAKGGEGGGLATSQGTPTIEGTGQQLQQQGAQNWSSGISNMIGAGQQAQANNGAAQGQFANVQAASQAPNMGQYQYGAPSPYMQYRR
jgi:hypothetical protein